MLPRSIWVTTSPTRTPSGRSPARASASSSARPTIRRSGAVAHPPRSCWTRSRRWNDFWTRWPGERRARRRGGRRLRQLRARRGGPARGPDLHRQRVLLHPRGRRVGGHGPAPTTRAPTRTAATTARRRSSAGGRCSTRTWSTCRTGSCSSCASRARRRSGSTTSRCSSTRHSYDIRSALLLPRRSASGTAPGRETSLRSRRFVCMAAQSPGGDRVGADPGELVGADRSHLRDRRARRQPWVARYRDLEGRHLDPVIPAHLRAGNHRAEGADPQVEPLLRRGRPHPRLSGAGPEPVEPKRSCTR